MAREKTGYNKKMQRLDALAAFLAAFAVLLEEIPEEKRNAVKTPFCDAMGKYLEIVEGNNGEPNKNV